MPAMPMSRTIPGLLDELAARFPKREALVGGGRRYTYAALREEVRAFAKGLHALGVRKGDMVAILMGNKPEWIIADLAICSPRHHGRSQYLGHTRELGYVLAHSDATTLIASDQFLKYDYFAMLEDLEPLVHSMPRLELIIHVGARSYRSSISFDDVYARGDTVPDTEIERAARAIDPKDVAYLLYTSGSTSRPKGVLLQHFVLKTCGTSASACMSPSMTGYGWPYRCSGGSAARTHCSIC
jgi:fatty-acyl-CoA synthase